MKRTFPANIDGQVFYIDEDAYNLLSEYLQQLGATFRGEEGAEIVSDIESRIRELFTERGSAIIVLADVQNVIATMGRPEEINGDESETNNSTVPPETPADARFSWTKLGFQPQRRLFRNMQDKVFGGVFGGLASFLGWNANIMRILYVVLTIFIWTVTFWPPIIIYLIAWMVIPPAVTPRQVLEMKGEAVNVDNIGKTIITPPEYHEDGSGIITSALKTAGKILMAFVGFFSGLGLFASVILFLVVSVAMIAYSGFGMTGILNGLNLYDPYSIMDMWVKLWMFIDGSLMAMTVFGALVWTSSCILFKARAASKSTMIAWLITFTILLVIFFILMSLINS